MKTTNHIAKWIQAYFMLLFCISTVIFTACNEDKLNLDQEIYGLVEMTSKKMNWTNGYMKTIPKLTISK